MTSKCCGSKIVATIIYCLISPTLVLVEEFILAKQTYNIVRETGDICDKYKLGKKLTFVEKMKLLTSDPKSLFANSKYVDWKELAEEDKIKMEKYYKFVEKRINRRSQIMSREASIQLVYQTAYVMYQFKYVPVRDLTFDYKLIGIEASSIWITKLIWQVISIILSAYSTFAPILANFRFKTFKKYVEKKEPHLGFLIVKVIQVAIHIFFASGVICL